MKEIFRHHIVATYQIITFVLNYECLMVTCCIVSVWKYLDLIFEIELYGSELQRYISILEELILL